MKALTEDRAGQLEETAYEIRKLALEMITYAQWGHIGGSFSLAEIMSSLYFHALKVDPQDPRRETRDRVVLSKAHASPALYATLALRGFYPKEDVYRYCRLGGLDGHTSTRTPGIDNSGGSLGLGLGYATGMALGLKQKEQYAPRVFCVMGDGEQNEGQVWEAAMSASHYRLDNLIAIVDYNKVSAKGFTYQSMSVDPLEEKWTSFGWIVHSVDGHDVRELCAALYRARYLDVNGRPVCIVAHTAKGRGLEEAEFNYRWHTHAPHLEKAQSFLEELNRTTGHKGGFTKTRADYVDGGLRSVVEEAEA